MQSLLLKVTQVAIALEKLGYLTWLSGTQQ